MKDRLVWKNQTNRKSKENLHAASTDNNWLITWDMACLHYNLIMIYDSSCFKWIKRYSTTHAHRIREEKINETHKQLDKQWLHCKMHTAAASLYASLQHFSLSFVIDAKSVYFVLHRLQFCSYLEKKIFLRKNRFVFYS